MDTFLHGRCFRLSETECQKISLIFSPFEEDVNPIFLKGNSKSLDSLLQTSGRGTRGNWKAVSKTPYYLLPEVGNQGEPTDSRSNPAIFASEAERKVLTAYLVIRKNYCNVILWASILSYCKYRDKWPLKSPIWSYKINITCL